MFTELILLFVLCLICMIIFIKYQNDNVVYIKSDIDGELYLVRDVDDKRHAANVLANIKKNIMELTKYLYENKLQYPDYAIYIDQLNEKIKDVIILESSENSVYTSYSVNKGEQIVFCLRSKTIRNKMHDMNLIMYVVLHEISHVACPEFGHTLLFKKIFAFITNVAIGLNMYSKIEFSNIPTEYCGLMITDSII